MKVLDIISIALFAGLAIACLAIAILFHTWWHVLIGIMSATLAWGMSNGKKKRK